MAQTEVAELKRKLANGERNWKRIKSYVEVLEIENESLRDRIENMDELNTVLTNFRKHVLLQVLNEGWENE